MVTSTQRRVGVVLLAAGGGVALVLLYPALEGEVGRSERERKSLERVERRIEAMTPADALSRDARPLELTVISHGVDTARIRMQSDHGSRTFTVRLGDTGLEADDRRALQQAVQSSLADVDEPRVMLGTETEPSDDTHRVLMGLLNLLFEVGIRDVTFQK